MNQERLDFTVRRPMSRDADPDTSRDAASVIRVDLGRIQALVLNAYLEHGPMTARTCERLAVFEEYGFSTIRKRISELASSGFLRECGVDRSRRSPATIYEASGG